MTAAFDHFVDVAHRIRESAAALGDALDAVQVYVEPAVARAVQAERNLYDRIDAEFGLLTSAETGRRLGSRSPLHVIWPPRLAATERCWRLPAGTRCCSRDSSSTPMDGRSR